MFQISYRQFTIYIFHEKQYVSNKGNIVTKKGICFHQFQFKCNVSYDSRTFLESLHLEKSWSSHYFVKCCLHAYPSKEVIGYSKSIWNHHKIFCFVSSIRNINQLVKTITNYRDDVISIFINLLDIFLLERK